MKVCYVDESGNRVEDPCLVMVGVLVDSHRLNRTRKEFDGIFDDIQKLFDENLRELKGAKMIFGRDRWRTVDPEVRKRIAGQLCSWIVARKHLIALAGIDQQKLTTTHPPGLPEECHDRWLAGALHIALQVQKANQGKSHNKGHTFLIFDDNKVKADRLSELLWQPPSWSHDYYEKQKTDAPLDQIVDTTFSIKSHHAGLVQEADLFAFIFRRYAELTDYAKSEAWAGEKALIDEYVDTIKDQLLPRACRWAVKPKSTCAKWFNSIAPASLRDLGE